MWIIQGLTIDLTQNFRARVARLHWTTVKQQAFSSFNFMAPCFLRHTCQVCYRLLQYWMKVQVLMSAAHSFLTAMRLFYIRESVHHESNWITVQQDVTYSVYYISVGSSTCFGYWHPSSGACTNVNTASGIGQPGLSLLSPSSSSFHLHRHGCCCWTTRADCSRPGWPMPEAVTT